MATSERSLLDIDASRCTLYLYATFEHGADVGKDYLTKNRCPEASDVTSNVHWMQQIKKAKSTNISKASESFYKERIKSERGGTALIISYVGRAILILRGRCRGATWIRIRPILASLLTNKWLLALLIQSGTNSHTRRGGSPIWHRGKPGPRTPWCAQCNSSTE